MEERKKRFKILIEAIAFFACFGVLAFGFAESLDNNAAYFYKKAYSLAVLPADKGWEDNHEQLKEVLQKNQAAIAEFKKATELETCDYTFGESINKDMTTAFPRYDQAQALAKLVIAEAELCEKENKLDSALKNYLCVLRFAGHLEQQKDFILLSKMSEITLQESLYPPLSGYIKRKDISVDNYQILLDGLISLRNKKQGLEAAFEEEKVFLKNTGRIFAQEAREKDRYEEAFYQKFYRAYDKTVDEYLGYLTLAFKENESEIFEEKYSQFQKELEQQTKPLSMFWSAIKSMLGFSQEEKLDSPTLTARGLVSLALPRFAQAITKYYVSQCQLDILITAVAIKLYQLENGKIPDSLQELVPGYLLELAEDPFDNFKPLKYSKTDTGCIVFSLGPDKKGDIKLQLK